MTIADAEQLVLEAEPYRRLVLHLAHPHAGVGGGVELDEERPRRLAAEPRSKVTFEIEPLGEQVKLTVIHDDLEPGGITGSLISGGWPRVLANLKTLLETGDTLPDLGAEQPGPGTG